MGVGVGVDGPGVGEGVENGVVVAPNDWQESAHRNPRPLGVPRPPVTNFKTVSEVKVASSGLLLPQNLT